MAFKTITVPGHGDIDFPDTMSDDDIATAIRENILGGKPPAASAPEIKVPDLFATPPAGESKPAQPAFNPDPMAARIEDARTRDNPLSRVETPADKEAESVGAKFRAAREQRKVERQAVISENTKFTNATTPKPVPAPVTTPGQYAEATTGVPRSEGLAGKAVTAIGDPLDALVNVTSVPLVTLFRSKTYNERMGEKVLESEAGLQGQAAIRAAKIRRNNGHSNDGDAEILEADKFLNKAHAAYQAVMSDKTGAAGQLLLGVLEDAPIYILSAPVGGEVIKLAEGLYKEGAAAARLAKITERLGEGTPAAARAVRMGETSVAKAATKEALVKTPATVGSVAKATVEDAVGDVAAGGAVTQSRGQKYDAAQLAQDLVGSLAVAAGGSLIKALKDNRPLTAEEFQDLQKAVDVAGIHEHPQILDLLPGLKAAAGDEKFVNEGGKIRLEKAGKTLTHEEALASGYGSEFLAKLGITAEKPGEATGVTKGRDITLYGGADRGTLSEEMTHFRQNVLADKAAAAPESPEAVLAADIDKWVAETRAAATGPLPESNSEMFGQAYEGSLEGVVVPDDLRKRFEGVEVPELPPKLGEVEVPEKAAEVPELEVAKTPKFKEDIPTEEWLKENIEDAEATPRSKFGAPKMNKVTGSFDGPVMLPVDMLEKIRGLKGEQENVRIDDLNGIKEVIRETGKLPLTDDGKEYAPYIEIGYDGVPWVNDGNHRIMAAAAEGLKEIPVQIRYFDGGQRKAGNLAPEKIAPTSPQSGASEAPLYQIRKAPESLLKKSSNDQNLGPRLKNPINLDDGSRLSGFTDRDQTVFFGYDKNGEKFTLQQELLDPNKITGSRDGDKTASFFGGKKPDPDANYQLRASKGTPARAEQDRLAAVKTLHIMLADEVSAAKAAAKAGIKDDAIIKRAAALQRDIRKSGSYEEALARDALRGFTKPPVETIKQTILRTTGEGITGNEIITAKSALKDVIRRLQLEAKVDEEKAKGKARLEVQRQAIKEALEIRKALSEETRDMLPKELREKMLGTIAKAKTPRDWEKGLELLQNILDDEEVRLARTELQDLLKGTNPKLLRPEYRDKFLAVTEGIDPRALSDREESRLWKLADWYEKNKDTDNPDLEAIPKDELEKLKRLDQTRIADMNVHEIREITDMVQQILHQNELKNTLIGARTLRKLDETTEAATKQIEDFNKPLKETEGGRKERGFFSKNAADRASPKVMLASMGGPDGVLVRDLYRELALSRSDQYHMHLEMQNTMAEFFKSKGMTEGKLIDWKKEPVKVQMGGKTVTLSRDQLVSLYALTRNRKTMDEILKAGVIPEGFRGDASKKAIPSREDLNEAFSEMTDFETEMADVMIKNFNTFQPLANEVSVKIDGYEKFDVEDYFPRSRDISGREEELTDLHQFTRGTALEKRGFTRKRTPSKDPVILEGATAVFDRHSKDISDYIAMAIPVRNALRIIGAPNVKQAITTRFGTEAVQEVKNYLRDASGAGAPVSSQGADRFVRAAQRLFATGKLGWRVTTILNNLLGASVQVAGVIDPKYIGPFAKNFVNIREGGAAVASSLPTAIRKKLETKEFRKDFNEMVSLDGYFEQRYERDPFNVIMYGTSSIEPSISSSKAAAAMKRAQNLVMRPVQEAEKLSAIALYKAVRDNTSKAEAVTGMKELFGEGNFDPNDGDIVKQYAARYTMLTMRDTQNALDDLDKSSFARDMVRNPLKGIPYVFQSQLFKLNDMARMAMIDLKAAGGWSEASPAQRKKFARSMTAVAVSAALIPTAVSEFWKDYRRGFGEEDEREEAKRWGPTMSAIFNLTDVIAPEIGVVSRGAGAMVTGKGLGIGKGNYLSETMEGIFKGGREIFSEKDGSAEKAAKLLVKSSAMGGLPVESIYQLGEGIFNILGDEDPSLPLLNERYLLKKKFGVDEEGKPMPVKNALAAGSITTDEAKRYISLDRRIQAINKINESEMPEARKKELVKKLITDPQ